MQNHALSSLAAIKDRRWLAHPSRENAGLRWVLAMLHLSNGYLQRRLFDVHVLLLKVTETPE